MVDLILGPERIGENVVLRLDVIGWVLQCFYVEQQRVVHDIIFWEELGVSLENRIDLMALLLIQLDDWLLHLFLDCQQVNVFEGPSACKMLFEALLLFLGKL